MAMGVSASTASAATVFVGGPTYVADPGETNVLTVSPTADGKVTFTDSGATIADGDGVGGCEVVSNVATCPSGFGVNVTLDDLNGPVAGQQSLAGTNVMVSDDDAPPVAPPTEATGTDFDYDARTDSFAAVSAYYHANNFFTVLEDLGFDRNTYFDGTSFPVHVDHRASISDPNGIEINAFCGGDAQGDGIGLVGYCLSHLADTTNPLGRAVDKYVHSRHYEEL